MFPLLHPDDNDPVLALRLEQAAVSDQQNRSVSGDGAGGGNCTLFDVTPVTMTKAETILNLVCLSQGLPINLLIAAVILHNRRLHNPRNTFWLGIIALNLVTILMAVLKMATVYLLLVDGGFICLIFSFLTGIPYTILLFIMLLATLDRYVAITYPLYHRKRVTVRRVVIILVSVSTSVFILLSLPFICGWIPLKCGFNLTLGKWTMLLRSVLVALCIGAQVKVYVQTKKYLRMHEEQKKKQIPMKVINRQPQQKSLSSNTDDQQQQQQRSSVMTGKNNKKFFVQRRNNKTVSKLELEASLTLFIGVFSLCLMTAPMFIVYFAVSICQYFGDNCAYLVAAVPYVRQAALIHSVYGPLIYIVRSGEFHAAVRKILRPSRRLSDEFL